MLLLPSSFLFLRSLHRPPPSAVSAFLPFSLPLSSYFPSPCRCRSFQSNSSLLWRGMAVVPGVAVEEGSLSRRFWARSLREVAFSSYTPFVVCLAAGALELVSFRQFIAQDTYFLTAFAKAYDMAEECADDDDDRAMIRGLRNAVLEEQKLHDSVVKEWGIDSSKDIPANPVMTKYADFLLATAKGMVDGAKGPARIATPFEKTKIAAYIVGAIAPCMRLFSYLGKELQFYLKGEEKKHPYTKWIETYSAKSYEDSVIGIEDLLDKLSVTLTGGEIEVIGKLYQQAIKFEVEFFSCQTVKQPTIAPLIRSLNSKTKLLVLSDFDLTCTVVDSSAILAEIAILSSHKAEKKTSSDVRNSWNVLSRQYTEEYEHCIESILPSNDAKTFSYDQLHASLEVLADFEKRANSRVVESGLLKGVKLEDVKKAGEQLISQAGCKAFFQQLAKLKGNLHIDIHILSYCWCADLIRSAFSSAGCLDDLSIYSNELVFENSISTGEIERKIESPVHKLEKFKAIRGQLNANGGQLSVYIGDSVGDLLCLLEADVGIVVGSSMSLRQVGKHFGVTFVPLHRGVVDKQRQLCIDGVEQPGIWKGLSGVLYTVTSWSEIHAFVLGCHFS